MRPSPPEIQSAETLIRPYIRRTPVLTLAWSELGLDGATPAERYAATSKAAPRPGPLPAPISHTERRVRASGTVDLGNRFRVRIGHQWTGATVTVVRDNLDVAILHHGQVIKRLVIDPTRTDQVSGLKRGRPPKALPSEQS